MSLGEYLEPRRSEATRRSAFSRSAALCFSSLLTPLALSLINNLLMHIVPLLRKFTIQHIHKCD